MTSKLVHDEISQDLAQGMRQIADLVESKEVVGIVFGLALRGPGRRFHVNVAGSLAKDPTFARGILAAIDDELSAMVQAHALAATTMRGGL